MPEARVKLVVTGDDFGYCARRNRGIVEVFRAGGLSAVSLLVNGAGAKDAAELAKRYRAFITYILYIQLLFKVMIMIRGSGVNPMRVTAGVTCRVLYRLLHRLTI